MSVLCRTVNVLLMIERNVLPSEISLNLYFYAGTGPCVKGVKGQTAVKQHEEVKRAWSFDQFLNARKSPRKYSLFVYS